MNRSQASSFSVELAKAQQKAAEAETAAVMAKAQAEAELTQLKEEWMARAEDARLAARKEVEVMRQELETTKMIDEQLQTALAKQRREAKLSAVEQADQTAEAASLRSHTKAQIAEMRENQVAELQSMREAHYDECQRLRDRHDEYVAQYKQRSAEEKEEWDRRTNELREKHYSELAEREQSIQKMREAMQDLKEAKGGGDRKMQAALVEAHAGQRAAAAAAAELRRELSQARAAQKAAVEAAASSHHAMERQVKSTQEKLDEEALNRQLKENLLKQKEEDADEIKQQADNYKDVSAAQIREMRQSYVAARERWEIESDMRLKEMTQMRAQAESTEAELREALSLALDGERLALEKVATADTYAAERVAEALREKAEEDQKAGLVDMARTLEVTKSMKEQAEAAAAAVQAQAKATEASLREALDTACKEKRQLQSDLAEMKRDRTRAMERAAEEREKALLKEQATEQAQLVFRAKESAKAEEQKRVEALQADFVAKFKAQREREANAQAKAEDMATLLQQKAIAAEKEAEHLRAELKAAEEAFRLQRAEDERVLAKAKEEAERKAKETLDKLAEPPENETDQRAQLVSFRAKTKKLEEALKAKAEAEAQGAETASSTHAQYQEELEKLKTDAKAAQEKHDKACAAMTEEHERTMQQAKSLAEALREEVSKAWDSTEKAQKEAQLKVDQMQLEQVGYRKMAADMASVQQNKEAVMHKELISSRAKLEAVAAMLSESGLKLDDVVAGYQQKGKAKPASGSQRGGSGAVRLTGERDERSQRATSSRREQSKIEARVGGGME